jgi:DNA-binding CsgD family transcriptional regulator
VVQTFAVQAVDSSKMCRWIAGHDLLTPRERVVLAQIVKGASSKEAAQTLNIRPRTIKFHRANVLQELAAKNTAEVMRIVLGE